MSENYRADSKKNSQSNYDFLDRFILKIVLPIFVTFIIVVYGFSFQDSNSKRRNSILTRTDSDGPIQKVLITKNFE